MIASYWSFCGLGPFVIAVPFTTDAGATGPYVWSNQGSTAAGNSFTQPAAAPGGRIGAIVGQFLMVGDVLQKQTEIIGTGNAAATTFNFSLTHTPMLSTGSIYDQAGALAATFNNGTIVGSGLLSANSLPGTLYVLCDQYVNTSFSASIFSITIANDPGKALFTSITANGVTFNSSASTYAYANGVAQWSWGQPFNFARGIDYVVTFTGALFSFSFKGGSGAFPYTPGNRLLLYGYVLANGLGSINIAGTSTVNYLSGAVSLALNGAPQNNDSIYAQYTQAVPYRVQWCAIGDPTNWPIPLTANAIALQSSYEDLEVDLGAVKFIAGYPLYGVIFQEFGITRSNYVGGNVVFSFSVFERNRGLVGKGAAVQVGALVYFLSQDGFYVTDGNSVSPVGTDAQNESGIDEWALSNINVAALEAIRGGYDSPTRCVYFAIPTGTNTLPDTLLIYNPIASKWTKAAIPSQVIWTDKQPGNDVRLGLVDQSNQYSSLIGPTLNGYVESLDLTDSDGNLRFATGVRPNCASADTPQASVGVRNSMQDAVQYTPSNSPDPFSRIVSVLAEGLFVRVRISSASATSLNGATLYQQAGGEV
jgi:hypothetical protein